MLTLVKSLTIEGYTVYHDDENDIAALGGRMDALLAHDAAVAEAERAAMDGGTSAPPPPPHLTGDPPAARHFYVLPDLPSIANDAQGKPIFSLIVYRRDATRLDPDKFPRDGEAGGGILTFTTELSIPADKFNRIKSRLRTMVYGDTTDPTQDVELTYVDFIDGKVTVAVAGEGTGDAGDTKEFVVSAVGTGKISGVADNRKAVMVKLTQDGAALMSQLDKVRTLPINVTYELSYEHRLLGVTMRVWCDVVSSYHLLQQSFHEVQDESSGYLDMSHDSVHTDKITSVTELFVRNKTAGVEVIPQSSLIDNDTLLSLEKAGQDMLSKELEKIQDAKPPGPEMDRSWLDKYYSDVSSQLNVTIDRWMVLTRLYTPSANVANVFLPPNKIEDMLSFVDLRTGFFALLKVPIRVNANFDKLPLSMVVVTVSYSSRRPDGVTETRTDSFNFTDGSTVQSFLAFANTLDAVQYDYSVKVHYKDSQDQFGYERTGVSDTFLAIDVGTMGMIAVDVGMGLVDFDKFPTATVSVRYQSRALGTTVGQTFTLTKDKPTVLWTDIIKEESSGIYEYKVDWLRKADGAILPGQWTSASSLRLRIDAPTVDHLTVSAVCAGNFKDSGSDLLSHVVVSLRYSDPDNTYTQDGQLDFTDDKQLLTWTVDLRNASLRDYQYRFMKVYKDGVVKNVPPDGADGTHNWLPGPPGFITVGESYFMEVAVYPYLLQFGDQEKMVQVDLSYTNPQTHTKTTNTFVFNKDNSKLQTWRVQGDDTWPRSYSVDVTYFSAAGGQTHAPTQVREGDALIVPPLAAALAPGHP
ncbi:MAG: hypothetical protein ACHQE5_01180 [Actinomycetes bacterium]